jgi:hypothetical protein
VEYIYFLLCLAFVPAVQWGKSLESRNALLIIITAVAGIYIAVQHDVITLHGACIPALLFLTWLLCSLLWTDSKQSSWDFLTWCACLGPLFFAHAIPQKHLLLILVSPAPLMCAVTFYQRWKNRPPSGVIGNTNHQGALYLVYFFASLWLALHLSPWFYSMTVIVGIALAVTRCRGALAALFSSLAVTGFLMHRPEPLAISVALLSIMIVYSFKKGFLHRFVCLDRIRFYSSAWKAIAARPVYGWGLRMFRKINPEIMAGQADSVRTHRSHNDHLETMVEVGIVGYLLFLNIFRVPGIGDPVLFGMITAYAIDALVFFPFREPHTAAPFWAFMASFPLGSVPLTVHAGPSVCLLAVLVFGLAGYCAIKKLLAIRHYQAAVASCTGNPNDKATPARRLDMAITHDPYNAKYLDLAFVVNANRDPEKALRYAARNVVCFDGGKVKWGVLDSLARIVLATGTARIGKMLLREALRLNPGYDKARSLMKILEETEVPPCRQS